MTTTAPPTTIPACPDWCELPAGHPYVHDEMTREHAATIAILGDSTVKLTAFARFDLSTLMEKADDVRIDLVIEGDDVLTWADGILPANARALADMLHRGLHAAADRLDGTTFASRTRTPG